MRFILILVLIQSFTINKLSSKLSNETDEDESYKIWRINNKISFNDFKAKIDSTDFNIKAISNISISYQVKFIENRYLLETFAEFYKNQSWISIKTNYLLQHEQLHFDIAELERRNLIKLISSFRFDRVQFEIQIDSIYNSYMKIYLNLQNNYDEQTQHSVDSLEQKKWNNRINFELTQTEKWMINEIPINFE